MQEESLIKLLSETLKFYADKANYSNNQINLDGGHMARFAIEQVKQLDEKMNKLQSDFEKLQDQINDQTPEEIQKAIENLKNMQ